MFQPKNWNKIEIILNLKASERNIANMYGLSEPLKDAIDATVGSALFNLAR